MGRFFAVSIFLAVFIFGVIAASTLAGKSKEEKDGKENVLESPGKEELAPKPDADLDLKENQGSNRSRSSRQTESDQISDAVNSAVENAKNDPSVSKNEAVLSVSKTAGQPGVVSGYISKS